VSDLVVLQHHPRTGPSAFVEVLDARSSLAPWRLVEVAEGAPLPEAEGLAGLLVMGGPMGVGDLDDHPWMHAELDLLRAAVEAQVPVFGVCLGAQLLATALGGAVGRREVPEIGYLPLHRTETAGEHDASAGWPDGAVTLFFHQDQVRELPDGATPLLEGSDGPSAWAAGSALGVQFHPEVTAEQLAGWLELPELKAHLETAQVDGDALLQEAGRRERFTVPQGRALVGRWLDGPVRKHLAD
jgi:GMP synthase (glutamine-hydrolysing)